NGMVFNKNFIKFPMDSSLVTLEIPEWDMDSMILPITIMHLICFKIKNPNKKEVPNHIMKLETDYSDELKFFQNSQLHQLDINYYDFDIALIVPESVKILKIGSWYANNPIILP